MEGASALASSTVAIGDLIFFDYDSRNVTMSPWASERMTMNLLSRISIIGASAAVVACTTPARISGAPAAPNVEPAIMVGNAARLAGTTRSLISGKSYRFFETNDPGAQAATRPERRAMTAAALAADDVVVDDSNVFKGHARAQAKTTLAHAKVEKFPDLGALAASLPTDAFMLGYQPRIDRDTPRVAEESRNVAVCAWILATKREDDNDYHIMLGDDAGNIVFNAEMSGIPDTGTKSNRKKLLAARAAFESFVDEDGRKTGNYTGWGDPVPVYVEGSLFYDTEHRPGVVGPAFARPKSAWEIHPISKILFEPGTDLCN